jgi:hypothetical protein
MPKKSGTSCLKQSWVEQHLPESELCLGKKQLWLPYDFLKASVECSKQQGCGEDGLSGYLVIVLHSEKQPVHHRRA